MFKFVHAADLHIDSMLRGLERYPGAPAERIRNASRGALANLVRLCIDERASLLLLAGDLFDDEWRDYGTGLHFMAELGRLREAGVAVFIVYGNHDAACQFTRRLDPPSNVRVLKSERAESVAIEALNVVVHGQSYAERAVTRNLAADYPAPVAGAFNIGMLHTAAEGRVGHLPYAPCTVAGLTSRGYDYWALGHVHEREILSRDPWIVFPGNLQGRHVRECGPKGATLVTVDDAGHATLEARELDVVRWQRITIDATIALSADEVRAMVRRRVDEEMNAAGDRLLAARIQIEGMTPAHDAISRGAESFTEQLRADATDEGRGQVWLEKILLRTRSPIDRAALARRDDPIGGLLRSLADLRSDPPRLAALVAELTVELQKKLPSELLRGDDPLDFASPDLLAQLLDDTEALLLPLLLDAGGER